MAQKNLLSGDHRIPLNMRALGIATANYIYQLEVENKHGVFRQCKMMTAIK